MFKPDAPIERADQDLLDRAPFADSLANAILSYEDRASVVCGLYGAWGHGKSSVINIALEAMGHKAAALAKNERPVVIRFNPWNYSDQNQLISQFFWELSAALKRTDYSEDAKKIGKQLETYANFFVPLTLVVEPSGVAAALSKASFTAFKVVGRASSAWATLKHKDLAGVRAELDRLLGAQNRKIVIVVDDIDRLTSIEIRQIFQLVKLLGDFPNTVYLLAFDRNIVVKALDDVQSGNGADYLEKIIQVPFSLPEISRRDIERLFFNQLNEVIKDTPANWDNRRWGNVYHDGLKDLIGTVRDVTRYMNSLRFSYPMVKAEANAIDFCAITALQVFEPSIYEAIRSNKELFSGALRSSAYGPDVREEVKQGREQCDAIFSHAQALTSQELQVWLRRIFPRIEGFYSNMRHGPDAFAAWRREGRICSPENFDIYFKLALPKDEISNTQIRSTFTKAGDREAYSQVLQDLNASGKIVNYLERLEDFTDSNEISTDKIPTVISVLMNIGDTLPRGEEGAFSYGTSMRIMRIMYQLSQRIDTQEQRFEIFRSAIEGATDSIYTIVQEVAVQGQQHGKRVREHERPSPEETRTVSATRLSDLEKLANKKIESWADSGALDTHQRLVPILYSWREWTPKGIERVRAYVAQLIADDDGLMRFISAFESKGHSTSSGDSVSTVTWHMNLKDIGEFTDIQNVTERARKIRESVNFDNNLEERKRALQLFLDYVDGKIKPLWEI